MTRLFRAIVMLGFSSLLSGCGLKELIPEESRTLDIRASAENYEVIDKISFVFPRLGSIMFNQTSDSRFLSTSDSELLRKELLKSFQGESTEWEFMACEVRLFDISSWEDSTKHCVQNLVLDNSRLDFFFAAYNKYDNRRCMLTEKDCAIHQVLRVRHKADGINAPAIFVNKNKLPSAAVLLTRGLFDAPRVFPTPSFMIHDEFPIMLETQRFSYSFDEKLRKALESEHRFMNLVGLSNYWNEKRVDKQKGWVLTEGLALGSLSALTFWGTGASWSAFIKYAKAGKPLASLINLGNTLDSVAMALEIVNQTTAGRHISDVLQNQQVRDALMSLGVGTEQFRNASMAVFVTNICDVVSLTSLTAPALGASIKHGTLLKNLYERKGTKWVAEALRRDIVKVADHLVVLALMSHTGVLAYDVYKQHQTTVQNIADLIMNGKKDEITRIIRDISAGI